MRISARSLNDCIGAARESSNAMKSSLIDSTTLAVPARPQGDKAVYAVVADLVGERAAVIRGEADAIHPHVEDLPARVSPLEVVVDRNRRGPALLDQRPDGDLRLARLGAQRPELDHLVAVARERARIRAHQQSLELADELVLLLGRGAPPALPHGDLCGATEIEMRQHLRVDRVVDLPRIPGLDATVLPDRGDHLVGNLFHE